MKSLALTRRLSRRAVLSGLGAAAGFALQAADFSQTNASVANAIDWPPLHRVNGADLMAGEWAGLPSIVVFWETWCPFCKRHNARVELLYQATQGKSIRVLGVTTETDEAKIKAYVTANQLHFPVAMVHPEFRAQFTQRKVIPLTCLVSGENTLLQVIPGEMAQEDVFALARQLLNVGSKIPAN